MEGRSTSRRSPDFFIFGCERSGTTLLCALLSEHPDICVVNDTFIYNVLNNQGWPRKVKLAYKILSRAAHSPSLLSKSESSHLPPADRLVSAHLCNDYLAGLLDRYMRRAEGNWLAQYAERLEHDTIDRSGITTYRELLDTVLATLVPDDQKEKRLLGEKTPIHSHMQSWLRATYPKARIVVLVRHPITNVAAIFKRRESLGLDGAIKVYLSYYRGALAELLSRDQPGITIIRYEDLVGSPKETVGSLQQWLGGGANPVSETFHYFVKQAYVGDRIEPSRDDDLKALLDARQQREVLDRCAPIVREHYPSA